MKTYYNLILAFLLCLTSFSSRAQDPELFYTSGNDPCVPAEINLNNIVNGADSYDWDFGDGQTSTLADPQSVTYSEPGNYTITLDITTNSNQRILTNIRIIEAPDHELIGAPDFYTLIYDEFNNLIYRGHQVSQNPVVDLPHAVLLENEIYRVEIWDFELIGADDFCGTLLFNANEDDQTITAGPVTIQITIEDVAAQYSYSTEVEITQPVILPVDNHLVVQAPISQTPSHNHFTWFLDGVEIQNSDTVAITPTAPGVYTVLVDVLGGCQGLSTPYPYMVTSTEDELLNNKIKLYPNPFRDILLIEFENARHLSNSKILVLDSRGRNMSLEMTWNYKQLILNTHHLPQGIYFLQIEQEGRQLPVRKLVKF